MNKYFKNKKSHAFLNFIVTEVIDEFIGGALALLAVVFGINYFNLEENWLNAAQLFGQKFSIDLSNTELTLISQTIKNTFPFSVFNPTTVTTAIVVGVVIVIFGIIIKIIFTKTKGELVKDIGKIITIPALIGIISLILIQILSANSINNLFLTTSTDFETKLIGINPGVYIWSIMGVMFLIGISTLIFGLLLTSVIRALGYRPVFLLILGKFLTLIGFFSIGFYLIVRLLSIPIVAQTVLGETLLRLFVFTWFFSKTGFIVSLVIFAFGFETYKYGKFLERLEKKNRRRLEMQHYSHEGSGLQQPNFQYQVQKTQPIELQQHYYHRNLQAPTYNMTNYRKQIRKTKRKPIF